MPGGGGAVGPVHFVFVPCIGRRLSRMLPVATIWLACQDSYSYYKGSKGYSVAGRDKYAFDDQASKGAPSLPICMRRGLKLRYSH